MGCGVGAGEAEPAPDVVSGAAPFIAYRRGYKYQLSQTYTHRVRFPVERSTGCEYVGIDASGKLTIRRGYAWDGPSGPTFDTRNFMRASLVHDALYQLIRESLVPKNIRALADRELYLICREDGMSWLRAAWCYCAVRIFGRRSTLPSSRHLVLYAP